MLKTGCFALPKHDRDRLGLVRRGISIILLVVIVFASREVATVYSAPNREWRRSLIELLHGQHRQTALRDLLTPNSGEEVLPSLVRDMLTLLRRHGIQEFALSPEISASMVPNQRIVESAFPRKWCRLHAICWR